MTEYAYAKINLFLSVGEKRADGYHNIDTVMHTVSLCDEVIIEKAPALRVFCDMDVSEKDNLVLWLKYCENGRFSEMPK